MPFAEKILAANSARILPVLPERRLQRQMGGTLSVLPRKRGVRAPEMVLG
jgi:hypothetical protein